MLKAAKAYLSTQVTTATQGDLLLLLYDTAIKHIKLAKDKMAERDFAAKGILISKAIEIVSELHESLNKEKGGEVAKNLSKVYFLCNTRLLQANIEMNPARLDEVVGILSGLRQAFAQIIPGHEGMAPASQSAVLRSDSEPEAASTSAAAPPSAYPTAYPSGNLAGNLATSSVAQPAAAQPPSAVSQPGPAEPGDAEAAAPVADRAPVNGARFRAANAYANSH
ncbi:MAG: flagellar export chaperone FliS [Deltaproteobacteria bacterium HGW-Deltaproteobacteria-8]|jgi:flagellar protein FliS|nr:MAG: flagellar export chaperone FliS [Deltaproteobacteria bacterium HGW-Deltaproteobacteria-8]